MAFYTLTPFIGPILGPLFSGFVVLIIISPVTRIYHIPPHTDLLIRRATCDVIAMRR